MAKVLISPIGTGRKKINSDREYVEAKYRFVEEGKEYNTPFLAAALAEDIKVDKVVFIGTAKSMWEEIYKYFTENAGMELNYDYWAEIAELASSSNYNENNLEENTLDEAMNSVDKYLKTINPKATGGSLPLIIKYGISEAELWENFSIFMQLTEILKEGDEVYLDITHSFRSIPLFMYLMMDFIQTLKYKNITLEGLYYGMLEASGEMKYAPIIDLKPLFQISQWIRGTHDFVNFGNGYMISELTNEDDNISRNIKEISKRINNISDLININYLTDLQNQIKGLNKLVNEENIGLGAIMYIIPLMKDFTSRFSKTDKASEFQLELARWYFENKRFGHGYICLVESILTKLCEVYELDLSDFNNRNNIRELIVVRTHQRKSVELEKLAIKYRPINNIRNRIAHAAFYQEGNYSFRTDIDQAFKNYEDVKKILDHKEINELNIIIPIEDIKNFNK